MSVDRTYAERLTSSLDLSLPPVALAFRDELPDGVAQFDGVVPGGCSFWQEATRRTFVTSAVDHGMCSIGVHTHNLAGAPASQPEELQSCLEAMTGLDYVRQDEVASIPLLAREAKHVIYGPLAEFPVDPEVVLLFASSGQGLIVSEAVARVDAGTPPAMGRPACAVVPHVVNGGRAAMSLGCCGARAYLDALSDGVALWALPAGKLDGYVEAIETLAGANSTLTSFHEHRRREIEAGRRPTVAQTLERIS